MLTDNFKDYILYEKNNVITNIKKYYEEETHYHVIADWLGVFSNKVKFSAYDGCFIIPKNDFQKFLLNKRKDKILKIKERINDKPIIKKIFNKEEQMQSKSIKYENGDKVVLVKM